MILTELSGPKGQSMIRLPDSSNSEKVLEIQFTKYSLNTLLSLFFHFCSFLLSIFPLLGPILPASFLALGFLNLSPNCPYLSAFFFHQPSPHFHTSLKPALPHLSPSLSSSVFPPNLLSLPLPQPSKVAFPSKILSEIQSHEFKFIEVHVQSVHA